jgi:hypothetical protein
VNTSQDILKHLSPYKKKEPTKKKIPNKQYVASENQNIRDSFVFSMRMPLTPVSPVNTPLMTPVKNTPEKTKNISFLDTSSLFIRKRNPTRTMMAIEK